MTGEDSYHAACFKCRTCHKRIDELVFAKTSQGFYCMKCHNERVARSRRHMAKKQTKERDRQASSGTSGRDNRSSNGSSKQPHLDSAIANTVSSCLVILCQMLYSELSAMLNRIYQGVTFWGLCAISEHVTIGIHSLATFVVRRTYA